VGALLAELIRRAWPAASARYQVSVASGIVAGEGLMGIVLIAARDALHWLPAGH
jgi:hypothetical protein